MPFFNIVAASNENTVVTEYEPVKSRSDSYQSEAELEKEFIRLLTEQGYTYLQIHKEEDLIRNLRSCMEELNNYKFFDDEWSRFFSDALANPNEHIVEKTRKIHHIFGFTGTPIFAVNSDSRSNDKYFTTAQAFGDQLHTYTIVDAINDKNVLPFRVDYIKTMDMEEDITDEMVWDINREKTYQAPERIKLVTKYILDHFDQKTYRGNKSYYYNALMNIGEVASAANGKVEEEKRKQRLSGFNSILAVASVDMAKLYYQEFKKQMEADPTKKLRIATIYSYGANEEETDGILDEENPEDTSALDKSSRDFLDDAIKDYNEMFKTNYSTDGDRFQNYYKDVSLRMKNKELDLLIVVNMFLTGFDATTLNTLWVDKNLKMHGLIQAFSRTNRILNSIKTFGNIVCFRNLQKRVDSAISLFGDKNAGGIVLLW